MTSDQFGIRHSQLAIYSLSRFGCGKSGIETAGEARLAPCDGVSMQRSLGCYLIELFLHTSKGILRRLQVTLTQQVE